MSYGKITVQQTPNGRCLGVFLDGQRLPHVRGYRVTNSVNDAPIVTVELLATVETVTMEHFGHQVESVDSLAEEPTLVCHTCGVEFTDWIPA